MKPCQLFLVALFFSLLPLSLVWWRAWKFRKSDNTWKRMFAWWPQKIGDRWYWLIPFSQRMRHATSTEPLLYRKERKCAYGEGVSWHGFAGGGSE